MSKTSSKVHFLDEGKRDSSSSSSGSCCSSCSSCLSSGSRCSRCETGRYEYKAHRIVEIRRDGQRRVTTHVERSWY
ncbi:hypothetical protein K470DRAFT_20050 [Piedraia hortae CBS 480.64]|uniref:Uncharacterized protein n=1 Tax=Piedraia hortae CBS 480.64 TaxID=1314780 RepID=A0A6A7BQ84_9PEZI|nr:hypothetical protein K470DRAFT_20050 [Piedraia hortae CBS 480.64]